MESSLVFPQSPQGHLLVVLSSIPSVNASQHIIEAHAVRPTAIPVFPPQEQLQPIQPWNSKVELQSRHVLLYEVAALLGAVVAKFVDVRKQPGSPTGVAELDRYHLLVLIGRETYFKHWRNVECSYGWRDVVDRDKDIGSGVVRPSFAA